MVSPVELKERIKEFLKFDRNELVGLLAAVLITSFIFSFRDWGVDQFNLVVGLKNFLLVLIIVVISFSFRLSCQKIYGLAEGHLAKFRVWWTGLFIALIVAFLTKGILPLVIIGTMSISLMVKQRLGEFRYGFSYWNAAMIGLWGVFANLIMAIFFAFGAYFFPQNYFFNKGVLINLIMAFTSLLPFSQLDGLVTYFGSRNLYFFSLGLILLASILLLSKTAIGLIIAIILEVVITFVYLAIISEK